MSNGTDRGPEFTYHVPWRSSERRLAGRAGALSRRHTGLESTDGAETPLFEATSRWDIAIPPALGDNEDTPLFDTVPRYDQMRRSDETRLTKVFRVLPVPWQEILWFIHVEDVTLTEASIYLGLDVHEASQVAGQAIVGLRRAWVADVIAMDPVDRQCASAMWEFCGYEGERGAGHVANCETCTHIARRLDDVCLRAPQVLIPIALAHIDKGAYAQAV